MDAPGGVSDALKHGDIVIVKLIEARNLAKADFWPGNHVARSSIAYR